VREMTFDEYTNSNKDDTLTYWLESLQEKHRVFSDWS
jgi:hypothetical protein